MASICWLIAFVVLIGMEAATMALTTVWFAGGALVAFILSLFGVSVEVQLAVFVVVSFILLFFTRPLASKYVNGKTIKTNADSLVGKTARITAPVDNRLGVGAAVVGGQEWTVRASEDEETYPEGAMVTIREIQGVKLIVSSMESKTQRKAENQEQGVI